MPGFKIPYFPAGCGLADNGNGPSAAVETARAHRYQLSILEPMGTQSQGMLLFLEKCNRPAPEFDKIMIHSAQDEIPRPGKIHWRDIELSFYEKLSGEANGMLENQCARLIYEWWSKSMFDIERSLFKAPSSYLKDCELQMIDGDGVPVWTYKLYDCWPLKVSPSDLNYEESNISTITVTLAYARAKERGKKE